MNIFKRFFGQKKEKIGKEPSVKDVASARPDAERPLEELMQECEKLPAKIQRTEAYRQKALAAGHEKDAAKFLAKKMAQEERLAELQKILQSK